jgi:prepilin-type N-terminal cleavage/methylation domain-containing protein
MKTREGMTLMEMLVVIAIIGVLFAMLVPAVQRVRDVGYRVQCSNNLKQLGSALHQYHIEHKRFPAGVTDFNGSNPYPGLSWLGRLLPNLEQQGLWRITADAFQQSKSPFIDPPHVGLATVLPIIICPADGRIDTPHLNKGGWHYSAYTSYLGVEGKNDVARDGMLFLNSQVRLEEVTDGTSNTLMAGERPPSADLDFGWWYTGGGQRQTGSLDMVLGVQEFNLGGGPSCPPGPYEFGPGSFGNQCDMFHFWSPHFGGAHFLMVDGSVHFFSYSAVSVMPALSTRAGGEVFVFP